MNSEGIFQLDPVSEMEMWIACLGGYFKYHTLVFSRSSRVVGMDKNFYEELRTAGWILEKIHDLAAALALAELADVKKAGKTGAQAALHSEFAEYRSHTATASQIMALSDTVNDFRVILREKLETQAIPFAFFKSLGRLMNREFGVFRTNRTFTRMRQRHASRQWQGWMQQELFASIVAPEMRLETMALFARIHRILATLYYIRIGLRGHFNYRVFLALLSYLQGEGKTLMRRLEQWSIHWELQAPAAAETVSMLLFALKLETRRVFQGELSGVAKEIGIDGIYARLEDGAGLLWNCYQNVFISLARSLNPQFREQKIFTDIASRQEESIRLHTELLTMREMLNRIHDNYSLVDIADLQKILRVFRESSMRYLMFKDWRLFEGFIDQFRVTAYKDLSPVLHRFLVFLDTLISAVEKRAVLRALDEEPGQEDVEFRI